MTQHSRNRMSLPPPEGVVGPTLSPTELVAGVMLAGIAIVVAVMLLIMIPAAVSIPVAVALFAGPVWTGTAYVARRWRRRTARRQQHAGSSSPPPGADYSAPSSHGPQIAYVPPRSVPSRLVDP